MEDSGSWKVVSRRKQRRKNVSEDLRTRTPNNEQNVVNLEQGSIHLQRGISKLTNLLEGVQEVQFTSKEYIALFDVIYNLCTQKGTHDNQQKLYDRYKEVIEEYINKTVLPSLQDKHHETLLRELVKRLDHFKITVHWLTKFFGYLSLYFIPRMALPSLYEVGLRSFSNQVYAEIKNNVKDALIILIEREREGDQIDGALVKKSVQIFEEMGFGGIDVYERDFELAMITETAAYYSKKATSWVEGNCCQDYLLKVEECLQRENVSAGNYLHVSSESKLLERVRHELLVKYGNHLLKNEWSGLHALMRSNKVNDLSRMYKLFSRIPKGTESMAAIFTQEITHEGIALMKQAEEAAILKKVLVMFAIVDRYITEPYVPADKKNEREGCGLVCQALVHNLFQLHDKYSKYLTECFLNDSQFRKALKEGFEVLCNKDVAGSSSAELLATFCDHLLQKEGSKMLSDEDIEETLEKVVKVLAYIHQKDIFEEVYRTKLARRLLLNKNLTEGHEPSMIRKLKQECGSQFTSKLEGMISDLQLATENKIAFQDYLKHHPASNQGTDLSVRVLKTSSWPTYRSSDIVFPPEMVKCLEVYEEFYKAEQVSRKLTWIHNLGTCLIEVPLSTKYELVVTPYQAAVLLLFNEADGLSYADIKRRLNLADDEIVRLLHSLACAKHEILVKYPRTERVIPSDHFTFNTNFSAKTRRIKISLPPLDENKKVIQAVEEDRRSSIDASIVRILKRRKIIHYQQLVLETVEQLRVKFKPDPKLIKRRIEELIDREYCERDTEDPNRLIYLV